MRKLTPLLFCIVLLGSAGRAKADITPETCHRYLEMGQMNYSILVQTKDIVPDDPAPLVPRIQALEKKLARDPEDLDVIDELISLYGKDDREKEAKSLAEENLRYFIDRYRSRKDEKSALQFSRIVSTLGKRELYNDAYTALVPFLQKGRAAKETYVTAIDNRMAAEDFTLAGRVADFALQIYPEAAEIYFKKYQISFSGNIYTYISNLIQATQSQFLAEKDQATINAENAEQFLSLYIRNLRAGLDTESLERALKLDPDNYRLNLNAAVIRILTHFFTTAWTKILTSDLDEEDIGSILHQADPQESKAILESLNRASVERPDRDIQVYLAYALYHFVFGEPEMVRNYAELAMSTRPDLPQGYDAVIFSSYLPLFGMEDPSYQETNRIVARIIKEKMKNTGENADDYFSLAGLSFSLYKESALLKESASPEQGQLLADMKRYLEKSLELEEGNLPAMLGFGSYLILTGDYTGAIDHLESLRIRAPSDQIFLLLNNLGIAEVLAGDSQTGIDDLKQALSLKKDNEKTIEALKALGIEE